jgi:hypothetical protein
MKTCQGRNVSIARNIECIPGSTPRRRSPEAVGSAAQWQANAVIAASMQSV